MKIVSQKGVAGYRLLLKAKSNALHVATLGRGNVAVAAAATLKFYFNVIERWFTTLAANEDEREKLSTATANKKKHPLQRSAPPSRGGCRQNKVAQRYIVQLRQARLHFTLFAIFQNIILIIFYCFQEAAKWQQKHRIWATGKQK